MTTHVNHPKHHCGIFGIIGHTNAATLTYMGLDALQHRGQEAAGITTVSNGAFQTHRGLGLVSQVFTPERLTAQSGTAAIGHVRYSTTGSSGLDNAQPISARSARGDIAIAHNGNLTNTWLLRRQLERKGAVFRGTTDSEAILQLLARAEGASWEEALVKTLPACDGAYSLALLTENKLIGVRDPFGFRPLVLGKLGDAVVLASETCALDIIGATALREVEPGEIIVIENGVIRSIQAFPKHTRRAFCIFEYIYFSRPDGIIMGKNVYAVRLNLGAELAKEYPIAADMVLPIPDSGNPAALGYARARDIPFEMAFVRNHYSGRTFLLPAQEHREARARMKLNLIPALVRGKRVVVVDDSLVRGNTARARVRTLREAGAKEVHLLISCPPHRHPCVYGIDFPNRKELMAANYSTDEIKTFLDVDSLGYLSEEGMIRATGLPRERFCLACHTGEYPVPYDEARYQEALARAACTKS